MKFTKKTVPQIPTRDNVSVAYAVHEGRQRTRAQWWQTVPLPLCCPCFIASSEPDNPHPPRVSICSHLSNKQGLHGTHDPRLWVECVREHAAQMLNPDTAPPESFLQRFCLCGEPFPTPQLRDAHALLAPLDGRVHGEFFDELKTAGGSGVIIDRKALRVTHATVLRLVTPSLAKLHSTWAEGITALLVRSFATPGLAPQGATLLPPGRSMLCTTDNDAVVQTIASDAVCTPTLSSEMKSATGSLAATLRTLASFGAVAGH